MQTAKPRASSRRFVRAASDVRNLAFAFARRHGRDRHECYAEACLLFVEACQDYDLGKGEFRMWMKHKVWNGLWMKVRAEIRRHAWMKTEGLRRQDILTEDRPSPLCNLSADAEAAAFLVLYPPPELSFAVSERGGPTPRGWRGAVREHLEVIGWRKTRIDRAFEELRTAFEEN